jgi:hypothetical protein
MVMNLSLFGKRKDKKIFGIPLLTATKKLQLAAHATETIGTGIAATQGWVLLLLFLPIKKSKREKAY